MILCNLISHFCCRKSLCEKKLENPLKTDRLFLQLTTKLVMNDNNPDGGLSIDSFELEDKLSKIRSQINSKLDNQNI